MHASKYSYFKIMHPSNLNSAHFKLHMPQSTLRSVHTMHERSLCRSMHAFKFVCKVWVRVLQSVHIFSNRRNACTHVATPSSVKLLLASVLQHAVHHAAALPHVKQRLAVLVAQLLQPGRTTFRWRRCEHAVADSLCLCLFFFNVLNCGSEKLTAISSNLPNSRVP